MQTMRVILLMIVMMMLMMVVTNPMALSEAGAGSQWTAWTVESSARPFQVGLNDSTVTPGRRGWNVMMISPSSRLPWCPVRSGACLRTRSLCRFEILGQEFVERGNYSPRRSAFQ